MVLNPIRQGAEVTLNFSLALEDGHIIDSNFDSSPATFSLGDGSLLPGFEEVLEGLVCGSEATFIVPAEKAFGQHNPQNVQLIKRSLFDQDELQRGVVISFENAGGELPGVVQSLSEHEVMVDFNHPLAGESIVFAVKIIDVKVQSAH
ncbi:MAG: peptidylprolyl isomerase [Cellvibrionales bacterium TMED148]|nr:peptidylprolyl isomerase [Porticoccaceae bacterium]RPG88790.1 MAG: peptidylprolyl isomerase [Cellvibrionales bacterium TMED148]|tara:strand:- start:392 stop:835 length:444 start_codon:yes stop_codon:yes gene_type:complete